MQKTSRLHRLLAVIVAVFMAVCCLPLNAFAANGEPTVANFYFQYNGKDVAVVRDVACVSGETFETEQFQLFLDTVSQEYEVIAGQTLVMGDSDNDFNVQVKPKITLQEINVSFSYNGSEVGKSQVLTTGQSIVVYDSVYSGMEPAGQVLDHWVYAGQTFAKGSTVTFEQLAAIIGTNVTPEGVAYISFNPVFVDAPVVTPTLQKISVKFVSNDGKELAAGYELTAGQSNVVYDSVYNGMEPAGQVLDHWVYAGQTFAKGSTVTFEQLAAIIGDNFTDEGVAYISFNPVFVDAPVVTPTLQKISVKFVSNDGKELAAGYELTAGQSNVIYDSVYDGMEPAGQVLDHWVYAGQDFAKGTTVTFEQLAAIIGDNFTDDGVAYISFNPVFVNKPVTQKLNKIIVQFMTNDGKELAAGYELTAGQSNVIYDSVYDGMEPAGQVLDRWVYASTDFVKGSQISFESLAKMIGTNYDEEGTAWVTFNPVFVNKPSEGLKTIDVVFVTEDGKEVAGHYTMQANQSNFVYDSVYEGVCPEGKILDHWYLNGDQSKVFAPGAAVTFEQLAAVIGDNYDEKGVAYISFTPVFKGAKSVGLNFYDEENKEQVLETYVQLPEDAIHLNTSKIDLPDGYEFTATGDLAINDGWIYVGVKCVKTLRIYWAIDNENGSFANGQPNAWTQELTWKHVNDAIELPVVNTKSGYVMNGWSVSGQQGETWKPSLKTIHLGDKYVADEKGGIISITANIVTQTVSGNQESDKNDNSSNNTSSNNNNNSSTQTSTQVVKADAPAANTVKILPQTGLTAETPVVFGVMMFAALAGAGAYLFAIRKKLN